MATGYVGYPEANYLNNAIIILAASLNWQLQLRSKFAQ